MLPNNPTLERDDISSAAIDDSSMDEMSEEYSARQKVDEFMDESMDDVNIYPGFSMDLNLINNTISSQLAEIKKKGVKNRITKIHKNINFCYNSLNVCLGRQGSGKTTLLFTELLKLDSLPDQGNYEGIIYVTADDNQDETFLTLVSCVKHIAVKHARFDQVLDLLQQYFQMRDPKSNKHIFMVLEDATFKLVKDNSQWCNWLTQLRHFRMTVWINLHVWKAITNQIRTQITTLFVAPGYSRQQMQIIYRQCPIANYDSNHFIMVYNSCDPRKHEWIKIDCRSGMVSKI